MSENERKLALIIANYSYDSNKLPPLTAPAKDAEVLAQILKKPELGGFDDVEVLLNQPSSKVQLKVSAFFKKKRPKDLLLFYYSGHGIQDTHQQRLYLTTRDTDPEYPRVTSLPSNLVREEMDESRSERIVLILDCCFSGAFVEGTKAAIGTSVGTKTIFKGNGKGRIILTATDTTQIAWEGKKILGNTEHSLFTYYLIQGITTGQANPSNEWITIDDVYEYVYNNVISHQTPHKWAYTQEGKIIIARNPFFVSAPAKTPTNKPKTSATQQRGQNYEQVCQVTLSEARLGTTRILQIGDKRRVEVKIPPDVDTGTKIRVKGLGAPGNPPGDLYLLIQVEDDSSSPKLPGTISLEILGGKATPLLKKGTSLPAEVTEVFTTAEDNQIAVDIKLYFGESEQATDNTLLGKFRLDGILPAPRGVPKIEVKFCVDKHLKLELTATDLATQRTQQLESVDLQLADPEYVSEFFRELFGKDGFSQKK